MIDKQFEGGERYDASSFNEGASDIVEQQQKPPKGHAVPKVGAGAKHYRENAYASR